MLQLYPTLSKELKILELFIILYMQELNKL